MCVASIVILAIDSMIAQDSMDLDTIDMSLYFLDSEGQKLVPERRTVEYSGDITDQIKLVLIELIKGPVTGLAPTMPQGVDVREVFLDEKDCAYIDFSRTLSQNHPGGITGEMVTIGSIVNTLTSTFPKKIKKVRILIDGREVSTIAGHIDIMKPFSL